ncbi:MAG: IS30 family transposase [Candidatus Peribacteria bacterium]|nr:IS30 family transposase [Candidatus Peribacteria bacterium]
MRLINTTRKTNKAYYHSKIETVKHAMIEKLSGYKVRSITSDNGTEFAGLAEVRKVVGCLVYRCHPYASREKGGNERNNGIIRRFCPKQLSIQQYSEEYIRKIETKINSKPRKILNYTSALIVFTYYLNNGS